MNAKETGALIAALRREKGTTQKQLAEKIGVTDKAVSRWETGKGFPDTALLKPLAEELGISVGELLAGKHLEEEEKTEELDRVLLETLSYTSRMSPRVLRIATGFAGVCLLVMPLFLAVQNGMKLLLTVAGMLFLLLAWRGDFLKRKICFQEKPLYLFSVVLIGAALLLECLPFGAALVFMNGPDSAVKRTFCYFDLVLIGYANFLPMLAGVCTVVAFLLGIWTWFHFERCSRAPAWLCVLFAALLAVMPAIVMGPDCMTGISWLVSVLLWLAVLLQTVANRKK